MPRLSQSPVQVPRPRRHDCTKMFGVLTPFGIASLCATVLARASNRTVQTMIAVSHVLRDTVAARCISRPAIHENPDVCSFAYLVIAGGVGLPACVARECVVAS